MKNKTDSDPKTSEQHGGEKHDDHKGAPREANTPSNPSKDGNKE
jgi:hypothetical protein